MFEHEMDIVAKLLEDNPQFKSLYDRHTQLKREVHDAETGAMAVDSLHLGTMKKEKLLAKDKMAVMIADYQRERSGPGLQRH